MLPNPDEVLKRTGKSIDVFRKLVNHYQVGTCIESRKAGTLKKLWTLEKEETTSKQLDFYKRFFNSINVYELIENILDTPLYGFTVFEITWKKEDNYIIPAKIESKPQEWFFYNSDNQICFKHKQHSSGLVLNDNSLKYIIARNKPTYTNPYGQAILARCFWKVAFINGGMEFWAKFTEKYGMPFVIGKYDRNTPQEEKENLLDSLVNMVQDAVAVIPNDGAVDCLDIGKSANAEIYEKLITKCEQNIAKSILGQTLTTDVGSSGSYAAANTHNMVRNDIIDSDARLCENVINQIIKMINDINFAEIDTPVFTLYDEEDVDLNIAERDNKLFSTGARFTKKYFIKTYGFDDEDLDVIYPPQNEFSQFSESDKVFEDDIDRLLKTLNTQEVNNILEPNVKEIIEFFNQTRDADEALEKLADLYPNFNNEELEKLLTKVIFISSILGRVENEE